MGGKVWTDDEERHFWKVIIPLSTKRKGIHLSNPEQTWEDLASKMQDDMGDKAKRMYTSLMLCKKILASKLEVVRNLIANLEP